MSTDAAERATLLRLRIAAALLAALALSWPAPVSWVPRAILRVEPGSFPGREAPELDVLYWAFVVLLLVLACPSMDAARAGWRDLVRLQRSLTSGPRAAVRLVPMLGTLLIGCVLLASSLALDAQIVELLARRDLASHPLIRLTNRAAGGANPMLVVLVLFCAAAGLRSEKLFRLLSSIVTAGAGAGVAAQLLKRIISRARPELWLGSSAIVDQTSSSFPSGHTAGAFAFAASAWFHVDSLAVRLLALAAASAVGLARIAAFRHWPSDVIASAILGWCAAAVVAWKLETSRATSGDVRASRSAERPPSRPMDR